MPTHYSTGLLANHLGISKTALTHYITILEEHGMDIRRNSRMHRELSEDNVQLLRAFLTLYKTQGYKLKDAAQAVMAPGYQLSVQAPFVSETGIITADAHLAQFEDISNSMQLMATHIYGIEQQNTQLLTLIEEQRTQNELLLEQNQTLKQQLGVMMQHIMEQSATNDARQLDRVEQQNSAIMSTLNRLNSSIYDLNEQTKQPEEQKEKGLFKKLFK